MTGTCTASRSSIRATARLLRSARIATVSMSQTSPVSSTMRLASLKSLLTRPAVTMAAATSPIAADTRRTSAGPSVSSRATSSAERPST